MLIDKPELVVLYGNMNEIDRLTLAFLKSRLPPEEEKEAHRKALYELAENLGGCFIDLMSGRYRINPLEPKTWDEGGSPEDTDAPQAFRQSTKLSQHISFLKDFFRSRE